VAKRFRAGARLSGLPKGLSEDELAHQTQAFYEHAEERALTCYLECPAEGGACSEQMLCLSPGDQPYWDPQKRLLTVRQCDRWQEYSIRSSLVLAGVDARSSGFRLGALNGIGMYNGSTSEFINGALQGTDSWFVVCAPAQVGKIISVGVLRNLRSHGSEKSLWYQNCEMLFSRLKAFYSDKATEDPTDRLRRYYLVVFDMFNPARYPGWMLSEIQDVLHERWSNRLPTMLVTQGKLKQLSSSLPVVSEAIALAKFCKVGEEGEEGEEGE